MSQVVVLRATSLPVGGESLPVQVVLKGSKVALGRSKAVADIVLNSKPKVVSRLHASLIREGQQEIQAQKFGGGCLLSAFCSKSKASRSSDGGSDSVSDSASGTRKPTSGWIIRDEGSVNGTFVNGTQIESRQSVQLRVGDVVSFSANGKLKYQVVVCSESEAASFTEEGNEGTMLAKLLVPDDNKATIAEGKCGPLSWLCNPGIDTNCTETNLSSNKSLKRARSSDPFSPRSSASIGMPPSVLDSTTTRGESRTETGPACPFGMLIEMVKTQAKRLCTAAECKEQQEQLMAAANAACQAVSESQQQLVNSQTGPASISSSSSSNASTSCPATVKECSKTISYIPLKDEAVPAECKALANPCNSNMDECNVPKTLSETKPSSSRDEALKEKEAALKAANQRIMELTSELKCPICQDPFMQTNTLECGHSYCEPCVNKWLGKCLSCPVCRCTVTKPPTQSLTIDKAVEVTLQSTDKTGLEALQVRRKEYSSNLSEQAERKSQLEQALGCAAQKGLKLVHIAKPWSEREQCRFLKGLRCYQGGPREAYCSSVCLSEAFVNHASIMDLAIAARNVKLGARDPVPLDFNCLDAAALRNRLFMFLKYC